MKRAALLLLVVLLAVIAACEAQSTQPAATPESIATPLTPPELPTLSPTVAPEATAPRISPAVTPLSQPMLLRRSCGKDYVLRADTPITLYYGGWPTKTLELAEMWATSLVVDLEIDGQPVPGQPQAPSADLPYNCPKDPENSYWVYYATYLGGLTPGIHQASVTFHALRQLPDGYGDALYGPGELAHQTFSVRVIGVPPSPTPRPQPSVTPTPLLVVDGRNQAIVYADILGLGWENWSWDSTVHVASSQHAHDGTVSIRAELEPWGALSLQYPSGFRTSPYHWIELYIYVGENTLRRLSFVFNGNSDNDLLPRLLIDDPEYIAGGAYIANRWQRVRIPLAETGGADRVIWGINFNDASGDGQEPFWVDGIRFVGATPVLSPAPATTPVVLADHASQSVVYKNALALGWEDWSWYSIVDLASSEHAHSRPVSIKASLRSTGAVSLYFPRFSTAPYYWLEFYVYVGENTLRQLSVYFNDASDKELMPKVSVDDPAFIAGGTYIANRWQRVRIPLLQTGGADMDILRINIKDESGAGQAAFWIDDIQLIPAVPPSP